MKDEKDGLSESNLKEKQLLWIELCPSQIHVKVLTPNEAVCGDWIS